MAVTIDGTNVKLNGSEYPAGALSRVSSLSALKALVPSDGWMRSYDGRIWVYDVSSSATASNDIIAPDSGTGRWIAQQYATGPIDAYYHGVRTTNTAAVNTTNLNAALSLAAAASGGAGVVEIVIAGVYNINGTITVPTGTSLIMGAGAYLQVPAGFTSVGVLLNEHGNSMSTSSRHEINIRKAAIEWYGASPTDTSSVGIRLINCHDLHVAFRVENFYTGFDAVGAGPYTPPNGGNTAYNTFYPLHCRDCKRGIVGRTESGGYCNENKVFGGHIWGTSNTGYDTAGLPETSWITADGRRAYKEAGVMSGTTFIDLSDPTTNNWVIEGVSVEGGLNDKAIDIGGQFHTLVGNRYESDGAFPPSIAVHFRSTSANCQLIGGYDTWSPDHSTNVMFIDDSPLKSNSFHGVRGSRIQGGISPFGGPGLEVTALGSSAAVAHQIKDLNGYITVEIQGNGSYEYYAGGKRLAMADLAPTLVILKALVPADADQAYYAGNIWNYDIGSSATADDVTVIAPDSGTGRWLVGAATADLATAHYNGRVWTYDDDATEAASGTVIVPVGSVGRWFRGAVSGTSRFPWLRYTSGYIYVGQGRQAPRQWYVVTGTTTAGYGMRTQIPTDLFANLGISSGYKIDAYSGSTIEVSSGATLDVQNGSTCNLNAAAISMANLPTSNPGAGLLWNNSGVVTVGT